MSKHRTSSYCAFCNAYIGNKDVCPKCGTQKGKKQTIGASRVKSTKRVKV